jgi:hypothetical protein
MADMVLAVADIIKVAVAAMGDRAVAAVPAGAIRAATSLSGECRTPTSSR